MAITVITGQPLLFPQMPCAPLITMIAPSNAPLGLVNLDICKAEIAVLLRLNVQMAVI